MRVSNELGAGKAHAARSAVAVAVLLALVDGTVMACSIYSLRDRWGWAFTNDFEVVQHVAQTAPYLAALSFLYALGAILSGTLSNCHQSFFLSAGVNQESICLFKVLQ